MFIEIKSEKETIYLNVDDVKKVKIVSSDVKSILVINTTDSRYSLHFDSADGAEQAWRGTDEDIMPLKGFSLFQ